MCRKQHFLAVFLTLFLFIGHEPIANAETTARNSIESQVAGSNPALLLENGDQTAFVNVTVIPMANNAEADNRMLENQTVIVTGDRITTIGPTDEIDVPQGATVIDGTGAYLLPGLVDTHVHIYNRHSEGQKEKSE